MKIVYTARLPEGAQERVAARFAEVKLVAVSPGDADFTNHIEDAEVIAGWVPPAELVRCKALSWLQLGSAGAEHFVGVVPGAVRLTNASGVFDTVMAEHAFALLLALTRGIDGMVRAQLEQKWTQQVRRGDLSGATLTVVGLGNAGGAIARRAKAFGMRVFGVKRRLVECPPYVDRIATLESLQDLLPETDHLMLVLPGGAHTRHLIGAQEIARLPRSACIYNLGRGSVLDEQALIDALSTGTIGGAGLDVFDEEPLDPVSPLWSLPNVIVSPHLGGRTSHYPKLFFDLFLENLARLRAGLPLRNEVDRVLGY